MKINDILHPSYRVLLEAWDFSTAYVKASSIFGLISALFLMRTTTFANVHLGITGTLFWMICIIILLDFITGILAAKQKGQKITSGKGVRSMIKLGAYFVFLYSLHALAKDSLFPGAKPVIQMLHYYITLHIFFWEFFSIDENLKALGINLGLTKIIKNIFSTIKAKAEKEVTKGSEENKP